ncbi:hypothetical protein B0T21DRAFT_366424 [Apiosordaria backusii]|uniref:RING-type domain-containing protein n=1 Tax=Apiosordaria backusii TaxID=314023 RepID=A0AA40BL06_9PEZI|nr:hypothetical protein B0T21DRAFT_366424 [Apiosordaria backusii]
MTAPAPDNPNRSAPWYYDESQRSTTPEPPDDRVTGEQTNIWIDIKTWILHVAGTPDAYYQRPAPFAVCGACQITEIDIKGIPKSNTPGLSMGLGTVLICGHILCARCYNNWCKQKYNAAGPEAGLLCPMCRTKLHCDSIACKDIFYPYVIPPKRHEKSPGDGWKEFLDLIPLTLAEGGARPTQCHVCRASRLVLLGLTAKHNFQRYCFEYLNRPRATWRELAYTDQEMHWLKETATYNPISHLLNRLKRELVMEHPSWGGPVHPSLHFVWRLYDVEPGQQVFKRKVRIAYRAMAQSGSDDDIRRLESPDEAEKTEEELEQNGFAARVGMVPVAVRASDFDDI